jgi:Cytochrome c oxidase subunit IV
MYRDAREDIAPPPTAPPTEEYEVAEQPVHLPPLSIWPITLALGITITGAGVITTMPVSIVGIIISLIAIIYWIQELRHEHQHSHPH